MSEMLNSLFVGKKTSDALVCKAKCIGIMIGLAARCSNGIRGGYVYVSVV